MPQERCFLVLEFADAPSQPVEQHAELFHVAWTLHADRVRELLRAEAAYRRAELAHRPRNEDREQCRQENRAGNHGRGLEQQGALQLVRSCRRLVDSSFDEHAALVH